MATSDWADILGQGKSSHFGKADYDKALRMWRAGSKLPSGQAITLEGIRDIAQKNKNVEAYDSNTDYKEFIDAVMQGTKTSSLGITQPGGGVTEQAKTHFGGTDLLHQEIQGTPYTEISDYIKTQPVSLDAAPKLQWVHNEASNIRAEEKADKVLEETIAESGRMADWRADQNKIRADEFKAQIDLMKEQARQAAETARIEGMKVRTSSPSRVGTSAGGIQATRSPAYRSGASSRGTAQFARSGRGSKIMGINLGST